MYITTNYRVGNNLNLYIDSIAGHYLPSMGGFNLTCFTLNGLYELFQKARAWWTYSNNDLPLIRYLGCTLTLYRAESSDTIFSYYNCYPMKASLETYQSTHPMIQLLTKHRKILKCRKHNPDRKPYKKIRIPPPAQFKNKWYFQKEIATIPLLMTITTATSLDRLYMPSNAISTTIGFFSLDTTFFQYHNFNTKNTSGYFPKENTYLYSYKNQTTQDINSILVKNLVYLGNTDDYENEKTIDQCQGNDLNAKFQYWATTKSVWGNIFNPKYLLKKQPVLLSTKSPSKLKQDITNLQDTTTIQNHQFTMLTQDTLRECRYNPLNDRGDENEVHILNISEPNRQWLPSTDPTLKCENLPLWLAWWGFLDWQRRSKGTQSIDTQYVCVFHTKYMEPKDLPYVVPIDDDMLNGKSPYRPKDQIIPSDYHYWRPKVNFQVQTINEFCTSGPGTIKLPNNVSAEAHYSYRFYFKLGGCASEEKNIKNPENQPVFPTPGNFLRQPSLQSPEMPIENYLYSFDWRRHLITEKATERISKHTISETDAFPPAGTTLLDPQTTHQTTPTTSSEEETEKETLQELIEQQHIQQNKFRRRILQLLNSHHVL